MRYSATKLLILSFLTLKLLPTSGEYCSRQQLWMVWKFKTTKWYNLERMCTSSIIQHQLQEQANHSTNHSIAFPMNGPVEFLKNLPCIDEKYCLQTSFLWPQDEWMKAGKYKYPYKIETEIAYDWSCVLVDANHPSIKNCIIDTSDNVCNDMNHVMETIIEEAITTTDQDIIGVSSVLDAKDKENSEDMCNIDHESASPYTIHTEDNQNHPSSMQASIQQSQSCWI
jgi:hypothetical protein